MAEQFVYRHGASGYAIDGLSSESLRHSLIERLESERFDPHLAENAPVWRWMRVDSEHWTIANVSLRVTSAGIRALEIRGIVLNAPDCDAIRWNPFLLADLFNDDDLWRTERIGHKCALDLRSWLRRNATDGYVSKAKARHWHVVAPNIVDLIQGVDLLHESDRKLIEFMAMADPEGANHRILAHSTGISKAEASGSPNVRPRLLPVLFIVACAFWGGTGIWALNLSMERDQLTITVNEREQWLHDRENILDSIRSEHDQERQRFGRERDELRRRLLQLASSSVGAAELPESIVDDVRRRRGHVQHYLDQAMLHDALEEWIELERAYGITEERIRRIEGAVTALRSRQQELNEQLRRTKQMPTGDDQVRQRLDRAIERTEQAAEEVLRVLQATGSFPRVRESRLSPEYRTSS